MIFSHNHPSGNSEPSQADKLLTQRLKETADAPAFYQNLAYSNAVQTQQAMSSIMVNQIQAMNQISNAATGKIIESIIETRPAEGGFDVAALQQLMKGAQSTPPVTATSN